MVEDSVQIIVEKNVEAKMRDGCILRADVYRPADDERHPVLIQRTPYNKDIEMPGPVMPSVLAAVAAGYVVVIQDVRASWASDGDDFFPYRDEAADGYDTVEWAASLPCSDGAVGAHGISYRGGTTWQLAAEAPPSLRAIVAMQAPDDFYVDHWWRGGALRLATLVMWMLTNRLGDLVRRGASVGQLHEIVETIDDLDNWLRHVPLSSFPPAHPEDPSFAPFFFETLRHPMADEWTRSILLPGGHRDVRVPALIIAGWHDLFLRSDLRHFAQMRQEAATEEAREHTRLIIGPWGHGEFRGSYGEVDFGLGANGAAIDLREPLSTLQLKWFDRWLQGTEHAVLDSPRIWLFVQGTNRWQEENDWPPTNAGPVTWYLGPDGRLDRNAAPCDGRPDVYVYDPHDPCPTRGGSSLLLPARYPLGPVDQAPILSRRDVVVYTSDPLASDLTVIGPITAVLYAATTGRDTDWVVKFCDVYPDGRTLNVTDGILRARFRNGLGGPALVEPGAVERYEIELDPTAIVFRPGHRLRLIVTSSDFPRYDRNPNTGDYGVEAGTFVAALQHIFHDSSRPSHILLPTVSQSAAR